MKFSHYCISCMHYQAPRIHFNVHYLQGIRDLTFMQATMFSQRTYFSERIPVGTFTMLEHPCRFLTIRSELCHDGAADEQVDLGVEQRELDEHGARPLVDPLLRLEPPHLTDQTSAAALQIHDVPRNTRHTRCL